MLGKTVRPASLFAFAFFKEAATIADPILDPLDRLLEDPHLVALSTQALANRSPGSSKAGREGIAPDRLLRCVYSSMSKVGRIANFTANCEPAFCIDASPAFMKTRSQTLAICVGPLLSLASKAL